MAKVTDTGSPAGEGNGAVNIDTNEFRALQGEVAELAARLAQLEQQAAIFENAEELFASTAVLSLACRASYQEGRRSVLGPDTVRRPRHLRAVR